MDGKASDLFRFCGKDFGGYPCDCTISNPPVCVPIPKGNNAWTRFASTNECAAKMIEQLQEGKIPSYASPLPGVIPPPPEELKAYVRSLIEDGPEIADAGMYVNEIEDAPSRLQRFMSGGTKICHFESWRNASFLGSLFHHIQLNSPTDVELTTWDLFHGHMFIHVSNLGNGELKADMGILFHAREFPLELRRDRIGKVVPVGSPDAGGPHDVRIGTKCSIKTDDYYLRNYMWLLSTNQVVVLNTHSPDLEGIIQNKEFHTVGSFYFKQIADINYFPPSGLCGNVHKLLSLANAAEEEVKTSTKQLQQVKCLGGASRKGHTRRRSVSKVLEKMKDNKDHRWLAAQVVHYVSHSKETARHIYATPLAMLMSPSLRIKEALKGVSREIRRLDRHALFTLQGMIINTDEPRHPRLEGRIPRNAHSFVLGEIRREEKRRDEKREKDNEKQYLRLVGMKFKPDHARRALELTRSKQTGLYSGYRAECLLQAAKAEYRSPELLQKFGGKSYDLDFVLEYQRHAFYADSTLRAIRLDAKEKIGPARAGEKVAKLVAVETHEKWERLRKRREMVVKILEAKGMSQKSECLPSSL